MYEKAVVGRVAGPLLPHMSALLLTEGQACSVLQFSGGRVPRRALFVVVCGTQGGGVSLYRELPSSSSVCGIRGGGVPFWVGALSSWPFLKPVVGPISHRSAAVRLWAHPGVGVGVSVCMPDVQVLQAEAQGAASLDGCIHWRLFLQSGVRRGGTGMPVALAVSKGRVLNSVLPAAMHRPIFLANSKGRVGPACRNATQGVYPGRADVTSCVGDWSCTAGECLQDLAENPSPACRNG